jgi:hypothetical protein
MALRLAACLPALQCSSLEQKPSLGLGCVLPQMLADADKKVELVVLGYGVKFLNPPGINSSGSSSSRAHSSRAAATAAGGALPRAEVCVQA